MVDDIAKQCNNNNFLKIHFNVKPQIKINAKEKKPMDQPKQLQESIVLPLCLNLKIKI